MSSTKTARDYLLPPDINILTEDQPLKIVNNFETLINMMRQLSLVCTMKNHTTTI